jgi:predicted enzyme related to lactoylglutathione lyase
MSERDGYPTGVPCWVETLQPDPAAAADFYGRLFGWEFAGPGEMAGESKGHYLVARMRGRDVAGIGSSPPQAPEGASCWTTQVRVESADRAAERAAEAGGAVPVAPTDAPPAGRFAVITDPAGAPFCVWEADAREGAMVINEPGAWAMSLLLTPDPAGAEAFYGSVFGWEAEDFGEGAAIFRLGGYVGGEPQQPVPRDVVAAMAPAADGAQARWDVDFWVGDVDVTAETAAANGGAVVAAPADNALAREATLADPAGATFTVSRIIAGG